MLILVSGGSASGKSRYAEELVVRTQAGERIYVATMQVWDAESRKRVERHRAMRAGKGFRTVERPVRLGEMPVPEGAVVLLEDLSNLVKNGRISKVAGLLGGMLSLRPIMGDDGHGSIAAIEKVRGTQNAMRRLVELIAEGTREAAASSLTMVLSYCNCPERALMLKKEFLEKCAALREVILVPTSGLSTVYAYDGGIVLAY